MNYKEFMAKLQSGQIETGDPVRGDTFQKFINCIQSLDRQGLIVPENTNPQEFVRMIETKYLIHIPTKRYDKLLEYEKRTFDQEMKDVKLDNAPNDAPEYLTPHQQELWRETQRLMKKS